MKDFLFKSQQLWNSALFQLHEGEQLFDVAVRRPDKVFSPRNLLRTKYHQITGYADPFLFENPKDGYLYLFNEKELLKAPAPLVAHRSKDLVHWESLGTILQEPFHLSFPFVFMHEGDYYMIPETRTQESVILYKADNFPFGWKQCKVLVKGDLYADSSVIFHNGTWFLFTTAWYGNKNGLRIFYADDLLGEYSEHPMSPITDDISLSRCAGSVFSHDGKLYRPAQDCHNYYGENVAIYEITDLSTSSYKERFVKTIIDKNQEWNKYGGHQFNFTEFKGEKVVVVDGIGDDNWVNNHTRKFFNIAHKRSKK